MSTDASRFHVPLRSLKPVRQIVIGTSLRPEEAPAVKSGLALAKALGAKAHVVHAVAWEPYGLQLGAAWPEATVSSVLVQRRETALADLVGAHDEARVSFGVELGSPSEQILQLAEKLGADLVVAGAAHRRSRLLGSTAEKLIRRARCPVLIVREALSLPLGRTLAPVDLSDLSADSFRCGLSFLHQLQPDDLGSVEALFVLSSLMRESAEQFKPEQLDRFAREELERFVGENAAETADRIELKVCVGGARDEILREAESAKTDLIVIGTHGRGGLERALIGSVTAGVARDAACSVLVIPSDVAFGAELVDAVAEQIEPHEWKVPQHEGSEA